MRSTGRPHVHASSYLEPPNLREVPAWRWDCLPCDWTSIAHPTWRHAMLDANRHARGLVHQASVYGSTYQRIRASIGYTDPATLTTPHPTLGD